MAINPQDIYGSPSPFVRNPLDDTDGLIVDRAASASALVAGISGGPGVTLAFNGFESTARTAGRRTLPRSIVVKTTASGGSGTFKTGAGNKWVATGTYQGLPVTDDFILTLTDGGETLRGANVQLFDDPMLVTIAIPGQNNTTAHYEIGVGDVGAPKDQVIRGFKMTTAGGVLVKGQDGKLEKVPVGALAVETVLADRIVAASGGLVTDANELTVYL